MKIKGVDIDRCWLDEAAEVCIGNIVDQGVAWVQSELVASRGRHHGGKGRRAHKKNAAKFGAG